MIIGYDYFLVDDISSTEVIEVANTDDDIVFDTCNPLSVAMQGITIQNAVYDELELLRNITQTITNTRRDDGWGDNTLMLARFQGDLNAGTISVGNYKLSSIQFLKRKRGEIEWQICKEVKYKGNEKTYSFVDKYIESEQEYEYCVRPIAKVYDDTGAYLKTAVGENTPTTLIRVVFDYAHLFDNEQSYDLLYDFKLGDITSNIDANIVTTLGGQYPFAIYGASKYRTGSASCLLVTEESATGTIDVGAEKILRNKINEFLSNKKPKILKCDDGTYLLISISDNFVLTPNNNLLGSYTLSFNYTEIGDANDIATLKKYGLWSDV